MSYLLFLSLLFSFIFMSLNHPLSMGLILLMQTINVTLIIGFMHINFWFSYILFLIIVGGMMVLFIYMTSIASNEKFKYSMKINITFTIWALFMSSLLFTDQMMINLLNSSLESISLNYKINMTLNKFLNFSSNLMLFMMIIYLFITLIAIVKITNTSYGALRQNF